MTEFLKKMSKQDIRNTLAIVFTIGSFIFLFKLLTKIIPDGNKEIVLTLGGVVFGQLSIIMGYYYVQSKSDNDKTKADHN